MEKKHRVDGRLPHDLEERLINWKSELEYLKETNPPIYYGGDIDETKTKLHILETHLFKVMAQSPTLEKSIKILVTLYSPSENLA